jgi:hypothetical protein
MPNSTYITKYQQLTIIHAMLIKIKASGTNTSHFNAALSVLVIFQILAAEPMKDIGADNTILSDASS